MKFGHFIGIIIALTILVAVELNSAKKVKTAGDFDKGGGKGGVWMVCGALLGSLIGGQSTIGTAQLSYVYGLSAIWFTIGAGLGCIALCFGYVIPLRKSRDTTLLEVIGDEYGPRAEYLGSVLCSIGILISVVSNIIAASALMMAVTGWPLWAAVILSVTLMIAYVVFGGALGAGMGGVVKIVLLYFTAVICIFLTIYLSGGLGPTSSLDLKFSDIFSRGVGTDISNSFSLILGVLSTQTYAQAIWSARSYHVARKASLISGILCVPVGFAGVLVGLYMRNFPLDNPAEAFPVFLMNNLSPVVGGVTLGALLITVVTGGGGLALGVSTIFVRDIFSKIWPQVKTGTRHIVVMRSTIIVVLVLTGIAAAMMPGAIINDMGFLSMGLRGTVIFIPLTLSLFYKGKFKSRSVILSMIIGPITIIVANLINIAIDPLATAVLVCIAVCLTGYKKTQKGERI